MCSVDPLVKTPSGPLPVDSVSHSPISHLKQHRQTKLMIMLSLLGNALGNINGSVYSDRVNLYIYWS